MAYKCWYFTYKVSNDKLYFKTSEKTLTITYSKKVNIKMYYGLFKTKSKKIFNERTTTEQLCCQFISVNPINTVIMIKNLHSISKIIQAILFLQQIIKRKNGMLFSYKFKHIYY